MSQCRARDWAVRRETPTCSRLVINVCRLEWKSANLPALSLYRRKSDASRSAFSLRVLASSIHFFRAAAKSFFIILAPRRSTPPETLPDTAKSNASSGRFPFVANHPRNSRRKRRRQLRQQWDRLPALAAERKEIEAKIAAANKALDEADQKHTDFTAPLQARLAEIREAGWTGESAKNELWQTCDDPNLKSQLADVLANLKKAHDEARNLRTLIDDLRGRASHDRTAAEMAKRIVHGEDRVNMFLERVKEHERKAAESESVLAKVQKTIAGLERQEAAVRERMLEP